MSATIDWHAFWLLVVMMSAVGIAVGVLVALVLWWITRPRPRRVLVRETEQFLAQAASRR